MWNLTHDTDEPNYEAETEPRTERADLWSPRGRGLDKDGVGNAG